MIQANELRIGNFVDVPNKSQSPFRVDYFDDKKVYQETGSYETPGFGFVPFHPLTWDLSECSPIPLTPELLERCGFISNPYQDRYELGDIHFEYCAIREMLWNEKFPHIKYLHQLMNLIHSITGTELEVKW